MFFPLVAIFFAALAFGAGASPVDQSTRGAVVNLRIEGDVRTIFEGPIFTRGHTVTTRSGGTHPCNGLNNNENPVAGPTCTSALDDAARQQGFTWDGSFQSEFDDYFVTRIAGVSNDTIRFWGILLGFQFIPVGGCQQEVQQGDDVLFAFPSFFCQGIDCTANQFLKLAGPNVATLGQPVVFTVTDGMTNAPVQGATVVGQESDANGQVTVTFAKAGERSVKAEKSTAIRSNKVDVNVIATPT